MKICSGCEKPKTEKRKATARKNHVVKYNFWLQVERKEAGRVVAVCAMRISTNLIFD